MSDVVAVIVPVLCLDKRDSGQLSRLIRAIQLQSARPAAVIIVDDASPQAVQSSDGVRLFRTEANQGPANARNVGIQHALAMGADIILMTDHDCVPDSDWIANMSRFLATPGRDACGGLTRALGSSLLDCFHNYNGTLNGRRTLSFPDQLLYAPTCNFGMTRRIAECYRFDTRFPTAAGEDVDFCLRIGAKYPVLFNPTAVVSHDFGYRNSIRGFRAFVRLFKKYRDANNLLYQAHPDYFKTSWHASQAIPYRGADVLH